MLRRSPEIRLDHVFVRGDVFVRALSDLDAVVEHNDPVRDITDHPHVVFDHDDGEAALVAQTGDPVR